ncbi:MAG TPA: clostripain-related cysteine peptidase [Methanospirillum sp.]|nr:clostripain-related cysteine peptidase [Methanospirillum sp.]
MRFFLILLIIILLFPAGALSADIPKTVLAVYIIGSDLEYDPLLSANDNAIHKGAGTNDMKEIVTGWGDGSDNLDIIVAYGGSKKKGWEGMTVATVDDLKKDLENNIIGDSENFYQGWEDANMASEIGISTFLKHIEKSYPDSRVFLILWDHGTAYYGFGRDDNFEGSTISPVALQKGLSNMKKPVEILGFDACFMADIEYLRFLHPYVQYVIASEETEPDHGWDYESLVKILKENPNQPAYDLGENIINSYMNNPAHQKGALSLSFLDLTYLPELLSTFESFSQALHSYASKPESYHTLSQWAGSLSRLGITKDIEGKEKHLMVDLLALAQIAQKEIPDISQEATALQDIVSKCILYSRQDSPQTQKHGIGIFSPVMASHQMYNNQIQKDTILNLSPEWIDFLNLFADQMRSDIISPNLVPYKNGFILKEDGYTLVTEVYYQYQDDNSRLILGQEPVERDADDHINLTPWDGSELYLGDEISSSILPAYFVETNENGIQLYYAWGELRQGEFQSLVRIDLWYNSEIGDLKWIIRPYSYDETGQQEFSRSAARLSTGDELQIYSRAITETGEYFWTEAGHVRWSEAAILQKKRMPCGKYGIAVVATDLAGNIGQSEVIPYDIPCTDTP